MVDQNQDVAIDESDIVTFLAGRGISVNDVTPYADGVASKNYRAIGPGNLDLTVRCDLRRPLDRVRDDRIYAALADEQGISVPSGPWIDGYIGNTATTARPTIDGKSIAQLTASQLPSPERIGKMLSALHKATPPSGDRRFFYAGLLDASDPLWGAFHQARDAFSRDTNISELIEQALTRLDSNVTRLGEVTDIPHCMIHGDFNPPNILVSNLNLTLIDWEKACAGYPVADLVQAIYYFSAWYGHYNLPFAGTFVQAYRGSHQIPQPTLEVWLSCFPAFIFLRDTVSATIQPPGPLRRMKLKRFQDYVQNDSAPRFRYFIENAQAIRHMVLD